MSFAKKWSSALLLLAALSQSVMADPALELTVTGPPEISDIDEYTVTATLKNIGDQDLDVYNDPNSVLSTTQTKSFKVLNAEDGSRPLFVGIAIKYLINPESSPYTHIAVGESVDVTHGLSTAYEFNAEGTYTVTPSTTFYYAGENRQPVRIEAKLTRSVRTKIAGNLKSRALEKRREQRRKRDLRKRAQATTANCETDVAAEITESMYHASLYAASSEKYLAMHNTTGTDRYETWFGTFSSANHAVVLDHFSKIRESDMKTYNYDCNCEVEDPVNTFAYVEPDKFGKVYLCGAYMNAPVSGPDSKAGTLVHEASHFIANGGTDDLAYGRPDASELAAQNATAAIGNADSHEYFAENVPWLA